MRSNPFGGNYIFRAYTSEGDGLSPRELEGSGVLIWASYLWSPWQPGTGASVTGDGCGTLGSGGDGPAHLLPYD